MIDFKQNPELSNFFEIEILSGELKVKLQGNNQIDRDHGKEEHDIFISIEDNYLGNGSKLQGYFFMLVPNTFFASLGTNVNSSMMIKLVLLDVNDNAPEMPQPDEFKISIAESAAVVNIQKCYDYVERIKCFIYLRILKLEVNYMPVI